MSKFLVQTKAFLPMVIQKSTTETIQVLENHPSVQNKLHKIDDPIDKVSKVNSILDEEDGLKIILQRNLETSKVITVEQVLKPQLTFSGALAKDVFLIQQWMVVKIARAHMWLFGEPLGLVRHVSPGHDSLVWLESKPQPHAQVKEEQPVSIILPRAAKETKPEPPVSQTPPAPATPVTPTPGSNLLEALLQRTPAWQNSISAHLGHLQKKLVEKLPKTS